MRQGLLISLYTHEQLDQSYSSVTFRQESLDAIRHSHTRQIILKGRHCARNVTRPSGNTIGNKRLIPNAPDTIAMNPKICPSDARAYVRACVYVGW